MAAHGQSPSPRAGRNEPGSVTWAAGASRLFNLVIALINEPGPRSLSWIRDHVEGYAGNPESSRKKLARDRATLQRMGIYIVEHSDGRRSVDPEEGHLWSLSAEDAFLPAIEFSEDELSVLAAATRWRHEGELADAADSAYLKLAGAGVRRSAGDTTVMNVPEGTELSPESVDAIFRALDRQLQVELTYRPSVLDEEQTRVLEPWAYGAIDGRMYVTGYDVDRGAQRTFRLSRVTSVRVLPAFARAGTPELPDQELIERGLRTARVRVSARIRFTGPGAGELRRIAVPEQGPAHHEGAECTIDTQPVDREWLVRTAAAYAPTAIVEAPADVVEDVLVLLRRAHRLTAPTGEEES
ncbi:helix-turn-helix transcriptional regulator [Corynebacterium heidelbergense]|uniref:WYL domain-containing protein n=1 Tax=Corynebacterium heidelbergense TaxID=2055947 RepID=A0A364V9P4_9CORY|nr:WYL domain-containing protein [Corynebacterium heidelbergense]RAV33380.1 WYL domain-containing protein [Corynebacterium heidelbergense]WCZ36523.1 hypothetical protein CHEID_04900 [Corynebacterium heidelbergense]